MTNLQQRSNPESAPHGVGETMDLGYLREKETVMKANVGGVDRVLRIFVGLTLIGLAATGKVGVWGWIGVVPVLTGTFRFCPAYMLGGISTCK
jgi:hypothetical protein